MTMRVVTLGWWLAIAAASAGFGQQRGTVLADLTWVEAEKALRPETVLLIPIGAEAKEHGPHLKLKTDYLQARYYTRQILERADVVVAPMVNYSFYPAFAEYPGSTSLRLETARDMLAEICRSLARYGPKRFYALNTGVSTLRALRPAAEILAGEGIVLRYTDILEVGAAAERQVRQEDGGTHADEIETSLMLFIDPASVDMRKAVKDYHPAEGPLTRDPHKPGAYSASGVYGDATLATRAKGEALARATVEGMLLEIEALRRAPVGGR